MADIYVHRFTATIADTDSAVTINEGGSEYTLQRGTPDAQYCFARITSSMSCGVDSNASAAGVKITYSTDITASMTLTRDGSSGANDYEIEIWEYTGSASGANEFINRGTGVISMTTTTTGSSGTVSGVVDDADVVVFRTGLLTNADYDDMNTRLAWDGANNEVDATRATSIGTVEASYDVVEFTGSNWTIQSDTFTMSTAGSEQTGDTITSVTDVANAFLEVGHDKGGNLDDIGVRVYLSNATTVSYFLESGASTAGTVQYYVIENSDLTCTHYTGVATTTNPQTETLSPTVTLTEAGLAGVTAHSSGTGTSVYRVTHEVVITATNEATITRVDSNNDADVAFTVVDVSGLSGGGGGGSTGQVVITATNDIQ